MNIYNPFLPANEYIPDGEVRVFGERIYLYGSHDRFNGKIFCLNDYVCYSTPVDRLGEWRYEGYIYRKKQDPLNMWGLNLLFAPDVVQGIDGRYYLYYGLDFRGVMGVAVCDTPTGVFTFLGHIRYPDGKRLGSKSGDHFPFDPGVLVDNGRVYLYSGFGGNIPFKNTDGGVVIELEEDMVTIKEEPKLLFPKKGPGSFIGHEFFEASSIRKIGELYYFIYSSRLNHELCYATSRYPDRDFLFRGTIISLGDLPEVGSVDERYGVNYLGNTHGSILDLGNRSFIFYHRQTNRHSYSRQMCAEEIFIEEDGGIEQVNVTSCGLNGGPITEYGEVEARTACNLWSKYGVGRYDSLLPRVILHRHPYFTQDKKDGEREASQFITNIRCGSVAGFKYFKLLHLNSITIKVRGRCKGKIEVATDCDFNNIVSIFDIETDNKNKWMESTTKIKLPEEETPLYFKYTGKGYVDFYSFTLHP